MTNTKSLCDYARENDCTTREALEKAVEQGLLIGHYATAREGAAESVSLETAREIAAEDAGVVWVREVVTYAYYWSALFGDQDASDVVWEHEITPGDRRGLSEWLGQSEAESWPTDPVDWPEAFGDYHRRALGELEAAAEADAAD